MDSMELFYTLEGHKGEVKAVCMAGKYLLSGAVDGFLKVLFSPQYNKI